MGAFNVMELPENKLSIILSFYEKGENQFTIAGSKYTAKDVSTLKIYTLEKDVDIEKFEKYCIDNHLISRNLIGYYFGEDCLKLLGNDVTEKYIGDNPFGFKAKKENVDVKSADLIMDIFISHSSKDVELAQTLIDLIRSSLNVPANRIRCTSVNGYKLQIGATTDQQLRAEIFGAKVFIGLISFSSINSTYVLFELGARWGAGLSLLPTIISPDGNKLLKGPLQNINALNCCNEEEVYQLINDIGEKLNRSVEKVSVYNKKVKELVQLCTENKVDNANSNTQGFSSLPKSAVNLSSEATELLVAASREPHGQMICHPYRLNPISINHKNYGDIRDNRSVKKYYLALDELSKLNLTEKISDEIVQLNYNGYSRADELK